MHTSCEAVEKRYGDDLLEGASEWREESTTQTVSNLEDFEASGFGWIIFDASVWSQL